MAFRSKVNWVDSEVNAAGYSRALVSGDYSGNVSFKPEHISLRKGDIVDIGLDVRYSKEKKQEYYNFKVLRLVTQVDGEQADTAR